MLSFPTTIVGKGKDIHFKMLLKYIIHLLKLFKVITTASKKFHYKTNYFLFEQRKQINHN